MGAAQGVGVRRRTQVVDAIKLGPGHRKPSRDGPRGEQQTVVAAPLPRRQYDLAQAEVEAGHGRPRAQLDALGVVKGGVVDRGVVKALLAPQVLLGKRWPLVGPHRLLPEQQDAALEALGT